MCLCISVQRRASDCAERALMRWMFLEGKRGRDEMRWDGIDVLTLLGRCCIFLFYFRCWGCFFSPSAAACVLRGGWLDRIAILLPSCIELCG